MPNHQSQLLTVIEKVRTSVTDGEGRYQIAELRPGTYSVHHALPLVIPSNALDVVTGEERWIAKGLNRAPRTRTELQTYFDPSIAEEARR